MMKLQEELAHDYQNSGHNLSHYCTTKNVIILDKLRNRLGAPNDALTKYDKR
jgi:hypothetical protein